MSHKHMKVSLNSMISSSILFILFILSLSSLTLRAGEGDALDIYFIDTEGGAATLIVTPLKESVLVDSGFPGERDAGRIVRAAKEVAQLTQIDHYITSHWHSDHVGGIPRLCQLIPVKRFYDHGIPHPLSPDISSEEVEAYRQASQGKSVALKAGDEILLKSESSSPSVKIKIIASDGSVLGEKPGAPQIRPCKVHKALPKDSSDNARSVAFLLTFGSFKFLDCADLTWNMEHKLACPVSLVGTVDVYQVDHHGEEISNNPAFVEAVKPRVAILNNGPQKGGAARTFQTLKSAPGLEAVFQLHRNVHTPEKDNAPPELIANEKANCQGEFIKLSVEKTGKSYTVSIPKKGTARSYGVR